MEVGVGSGNPVKRRAVESILNDGTGGFPEATVRAVPVASGVSEQPFGQEEALRGAETRARNVLRADGSDGSEEYDLAVGIEGGVAEMAVGGGIDDGTDEATGVGASVGSADDSDDGDRVAGARGSPALFLIMWAAVTDGDRWGRGAGPSVALPRSVAERLRAGEELGPVMDDVLGEENVAKRQGAAGALTGGRVDRTEALATAVAGALGPFVTERY
jgi:non-canonical (house-cleaning) NTP pyrophosphatase